MKQLVEYLASMPNGPITDTVELENHLMRCWYKFYGSRAKRMHRHKLQNRMEDVQWNPPILTFIVERHDKLNVGSTRAERQEWQLHLKLKTAWCETVGYRQVKPRQPFLKVRPIAENIFQLIMDHREDKRLKWHDDGSVDVYVDWDVPYSSGFKETVRARQVRLLKEMDKLMSETGWKPLGKGKYMPTGK